MKKLALASDLALPLDAATQKIAWLGRTGSGKTFACKRMVEQMLHAGIQVVVLDGAGVWPGLRLGTRSFDIPVLGGLYGDIPLESTGGALVADVIVDSGRSMVLDVSQMLDVERTRFATAFAQRFFYRKKASPGAVHLVLEECQDYVPENDQRGEERMLHEFVRLSKQGRSLGIGISFLSQRPQEVAKKALNQVECVFAFQMTGPQERKALQYWLSDKGFESKLADVLPHLEVGAPHVWSPQWLKISKVVHILPIETLDTSQTPKVGQKSFSQKRLKPIDLSALKTSMMETVERAAADDPKAIRAKYEAEIKTLKSNIREVPVISEATIKRIEKSFQEMRTNAERAAESWKGWYDALAAVTKIIEAFKVPVPAPATRRPMAPHPEMLPRQAHPVGNHEKPAGAPSGGLRRMMIALAQRPHGLTSAQLGVRAGLSSRSGTFATYLSRGRQCGWITDEGDRKKITPNGILAIGSYQPLPEGRALLDHWLSELGGGAQRMLAALAEAYPVTTTSEDLGAAADISHASGTFATYLSKLRTLELIEGSNRALRISEELTE